MAIFWALSCMILAALNDLVFKFYARKPRSQGYFVSIVGGVWMITGMCFVRQFDVNWQSTILWGAISGFFSVGGNLLMLDAMRSLDAGVCSTIYRLNLVPVTIGAAVLLGENISLQQYIGISCACGAVAAFLPRERSGKIMQTAFVMMIIASLMRAGMGLSYRYGFLHGADENWVVVVNSLFWIFGGLFYGKVRKTENDNQTDIKKLWGYALLSGVLVAGIVLTMAQSLVCGAASVVLPIAQMSFLVTGILGAILLKEKITFMRVIALLLGVAAILLLSIK